MAKSWKKPVTAFVMFDISPGEAHDVVKKLKKWRKKRGDYQKGSYVKGAWVVTGDHDAIAHIEADTNEQLMQLVRDIAKGGPHHSPGSILGTQTYVAANGLWG